MPKVCIYFQVHQPYRIRPYSLFEVGYSKPYFDDLKNKEICRKVAQKCYLPANKLFLKLLNKYPELKISYSLTGVVLDQFKEYEPEVLKSFQALAATGQVEFLGETYYHSLASLFSPPEFQEQVIKHSKVIKKYFKQTPKVFRNTELIYSDDIAGHVESMGFKAILTEGAEHVLKKRSPNYLYVAKNTKNLKILTKNFRLSDDIAFRFSDKEWSEWPLKAENYASWVHTLEGKADIINLFMDYETIGEHQWKETGIFSFFEKLPGLILANPAFSFTTPSEALSLNPVDTFSTKKPISWADSERDLSAWLGNPMQDSIAAWLYRLEKEVKKIGNKNLLETWRRLQTSDHLYYICTKFWADNDVHKYFSAFKSPHESYTYMNNVLTDFELKVKKKRHSS